MTGLATDNLLHQRNLFSLVWSLLILAGCAGGPQVKTSENPASDFTAFRSYDFVAPLSITEPDVRARLGDYLRQATATELEARGLTRSNTPDIRIDYLVMTVDKQRAWQAPASAPINSGIGRRSGWSNVDTSYAAKQTTKDTITIRIVDTQRKSVAWEASAREYITHNKDDELDAAVTELVGFLLAPFPVPELEK